MHTHTHKFACKGETAEHQHTHTNYTKSGVSAQLAIISPEVAIRPETPDTKTTSKLMLSGSKQAYDNGITTQTEKILCSGNQTNPNIRLSTKEEEYVISQLM